MFIEVAGGIAAGKTTLAAGLERNGLSAVLEDHKLNPFWRAFYEAPASYAFETELGFLLQHYHFARRALGRPGTYVLDHSFELDLAYARCGLSGRRLGIFESIYAEVRGELGWPSALIWLRCSPAEEMRRILARGREVETGVELGFLEALTRALDERIAGMAREDKVRVIEIDSERIDFRAGDGWIEELARELRAEAIVPGRD